MFTSKRKILDRGVWGYLAFAIGCVVVDNVYALFGHGVRSVYMDFMFLYPLVGGVLFRLVLNVLAPGLFDNPRSTAFANCLGAGVILLTVGSMLKGIMAIAGTDSALLWAYFIIGWAALGLSLVFLIRCLMGRN